VTDDLPGYLLRNWQPRHKGVQPWTWTPVAHAAPQDLALEAQAPNAAQRRTAPRARRHFGGQASPGGGPPPARLSDDAESVHARHSGLFELASAVLFIVVAALIYSKSPRYR